MILRLHAVQSHIGTLLRTFAGLAFRSQTCEMNVHLICRDTAWVPSSYKNEPESIILSAPFAICRLQASCLRSAVRLIDLLPLGDGFDHLRFGFSCLVGVIRTGGPETHFDAHVPSLWHPL